MKPSPRFYPLKNRSHAVARASVPLASGVWLEGVLILKSSEGFRVHFPERVIENEGREALWLPVLTFENERVRQKWEERILEFYRLWLKAEAGAGPEPSSREPSEG